MMALSKTPYATFTRVVIVGSFGLVITAACSGNDDDLFSDREDEAMGEADAATAPLPSCIAAECPGENPCCTADYQCGSLFGPTAANVRCLALNQPGTPDPTCPTEYLLGGNATGCCTSKGECGYNIDTAAEAGCVDPIQVGVTEPLSCGGA